MSGKWQGGKGSDPRPIADKKKFDENWDRIFGKKDQEQKLISGIYESAQFTVDAAYQAFGNKGEKTMEEFTYAIWPDGTICEQEFIGDMLTFKSDDYLLVTAEDEDAALDMAKDRGFL
jgi:hypothetical protein